MDERAQREGDLVKLIEALGRLSVTNEWSTLKQQVFDRVVESLERRIIAEAKKQPIDVAELYSLQGQLLWAKRYANLDKLKEVYQLELTNLRKLNPPTERVIAPDTYGIEH